METTILDAALSQGIWAVIAVFLLIYIVKENEKRDLRQEEREKNYQTIISQLTGQLETLSDVKNDVEEIRDYFLK